MNLENLRIRLTNLKAILVLKKKEGESVEERERCSIRNLKEILIILSLPKRMIKRIEKISR